MWEKLNQARMRVKRKYLALIGIIIALCLVGLPGKVAFADCRVEQSTGDGNRVVICSIDPPHTTGLSTGSGHDTISIESGALVTGYLPNNYTIDTGIGNDTITNYGTVQGTYSAIIMQSGNNVLNNYGSVLTGNHGVWTYDDGVWCKPHSGETCTINNYGTIHSYNEAIDIEGELGTLVVHNEGLIWSDEEEALHLIGAYNFITNLGTIDGRSIAIETSAGGGADVRNWGLIRSRAERGIDLDANPDVVYNYGTIRADRDPSIILSSGADTLYNYGIIEGFCYLDQQESVIEGGSGNDYILNSGTIRQLNQQYAAIEAGTGNDTVVIQGGAIQGAIDGDADDTLSDVTYFDLLIFEFRGTQSEADAFRAVVNSQTPQQGSAMWQNETYTWRNFEEIRVNITVVAGTPVPTRTSTAPPTPTVTRTPAPAMTPGEYEQTRSYFQYDGSWLTTNHTSASGGSYKASRGLTMASVTFTFQGNRLTIYRTMDNTMGAMRVCIDDVCHIVQSYNATPLYQQAVVFSVPNPSITHYVELQRISSGQINLDKVRVENVPSPGGTAIATATITPTPPPSSTPTATLIPTQTLIPTVTPTLSDTLPRFEPGYYEQNSTLFSYNGVWSTISHPNASGGSYRQSKDQSGKVSFYFRGDRLTLYRMMNNDRYTTRLCIDGGCQIVDNYYATQAFQAPITVSGFDPTLIHYVELTSTSSAFYDLDAILVEDTTQIAFTPRPTLTATAPPANTPTPPATLTPYGVTPLPTSGVEPTFTPTAVLTAPVLVSPANGAAVSSHQPTFEWQEVFGSYQYRIYIATDPEFVNIVSNQPVSGTTYTAINPLASSTTYYWRVRGSYDNGVAGPFSDVWTFSTPLATATPIPTITLTPTPSLVAPTLISPADGAFTSRMPTFEWSPVWGAAQYRINIATDPDFLNIISNQAVSGTTYTRTTNLALDTTYYWRVRATNVNGTSSAYSPGRSFTVMDITPEPTSTSGGVSTPTSTATPVPTLTPTSTSTLPPTLTPTSIPTSTQQPTSTPFSTATPVPTAAPTNTLIPTLTATSAASNVLGVGYYEQNHASLFYSGLWKPVNTSLASGGSYIYTTSSTGRVNFSFYGSTLTVIRRINSTRGSMDVCIDGACQRVSNYSATDLWRQPVSFYTTLGTHTVEIRRTSGTLDIDALRIEDGSPPPLTPTSTLMPTSTPASGPTNTAMPTLTATSGAPGEVLGVGYYEQNHASLLYSGLWKPANTSLASGGSYIYTSDSSARVNFSFYGSTLTVIRRISSTRGSMDVCIDGACQRVSNYSATDLWQQPVSLYTTLGTHTVEIRRTSGTLDIDALRIEDGSPPPLTPTPTAIATVQPTQPVTPSATPVPGSCPSAVPSGVTARRHTAQGDPRTLLLEWEDISDACEAVQSYKVIAWRGTYRQEWVFMRADIACNGTICTATITFDASQTQIYWRVTATNILGEGLSDNSKSYVVP